MAVIEYAVAMTNDQLHRALKDTQAAQREYGRAIIEICAQVAEKHLTGSGDFYDSRTPREVSLQIAEKIRQLAKAVPE